jgi:hypothetical protein
MILCAYSNQYNQCFFSLMQGPGIAFRFSHEIPLNQRKRMIYPVLGAYEKPIFFFRMQ